MRVCVVGCGAVGSLFAANLAQLDDVEVWAYDVSEAHVDAINAHGLRLTGAGDVVGLSYREAATHLGVKEATVTTRLHRARERVIAELEPAGKKSVRGGVTG